MKFVIRESKREIITQKFLTYNYDDLKPYPFRGWLMFSKNSHDKTVLAISPNREVLNISNEIINNLKSFFGYDEKESRRIVLNWFNETYNYKLERSFYDLGLK
jgi:hypothetical protein